MFKDKWNLWLILSLLFILVVQVSAVYFMVTWLYWFGWIGYANFGVCLWIGLREEKEDDFEETEELSPGIILDNEPLPIKYTDV